VLERQVAAAQAHLRAAPHLGCRGQGVVIRHDRQREHPVRIGAPGEIRNPVIVDLIGPATHVRVGDHVVDHQAAIDDFGRAPVPVQIGDPQFRRGRAGLRAATVVPVETSLFHFINMMERAGLVFQEPGTDTVPHPLVLAIDEPVQPVVALLDPRRVVFPLRGRRLRPQIRRAVGQVDVVVS
jgi:hypothetical protein